MNDLEKNTVSEYIKEFCINDKNCKNCKYPCANQGENLKPITIDELHGMGYVLCAEYIDEHMGEL